MSTDQDYALALLLQQEYSEEIEADDADLSNVLASQESENRQQEQKLAVNGPKSIIDPQWELMDPNPDIRGLFLSFNEMFFWGRLSGIEVRWSPRMTLCAGLCVYEGRGGLCSVRLSQPLLKLRPRKDLVETLLHEMIHAYLFITDNNKDHDGHGPEFQSHMNRINKDTGSSISIYHNFHDEVDNYRQHWWLCNGTCKKKPPYFGLVKRAMNRPPSPRDTWWGEHERTCGGTYSKIKEPDGFGKKTSKKGEEKSEKPAKSEKGGKSKDIRTMFGGSSVGGSTEQPKNPTTKKASGKGTSIKTGGSKTIVIPKPKREVKNGNGTQRDVEKPSGSSEPSRGSNIHGFGDDSNESTGSSSSGRSDLSDRRHGANIHGFNTNKDGSVSYDSTSRQTPEVSSVRDTFSGKGNVLGGKPVSDEERRNILLKRFKALNDATHYRELERAMKKQKENAIRSMVESEDSKKRRSSETGNQPPDKKTKTDTEHEVIDLCESSVEEPKQQEGQVGCPVCQKLVPESGINEHLDLCLFLQNNGELFHPS